MNKSSITVVSVLLKLALVFSSVNPVSICNCCLLVLIEIHRELSPECDRALDEDTNVT